MNAFLGFIETNIAVISLCAGIVAALIALLQLYWQYKEMKIGNRINSLESLASMLRNAITDKQGLMVMNTGKIKEFEALKSLSKDDEKNLQSNRDEKEQRNIEIRSLYNGLLSVNIERCKFMDDIEKKLDKNVSKAIVDMQAMFKRRKAEEEKKKLESEKQQQQEIRELQADLEGL